MAFYQIGAFKDQQQAMMGGLGGLGGSSPGDSPGFAPVDTTYQQAGQTLSDLQKILGKGDNSIRGIDNPSGITREQIEELFRTKNADLNAESMNYEGTINNMESRGTNHSTGYYNQGEFNIDSYMDHSLSKESGGNFKAKNSLSSATGGFQWIDSTWASMVKNNPDLGLTMDGRGNEAQERRAMRRFTEDNIKHLNRYNIPINNATVYAAHFLGPGGASSVLTKDDSVSLSNLLSPAVLKANPILRNMTVGGFKNWASKR